VLLAIAYPVLWVLAKPADEPSGRFAGEILGAEALLLFGIALVLVTVLPAIERAFGGLDRVALWHRDVAVAGVLLSIPHVALATSSPDRYATGAGPALGDLALVGFLGLTVWALAPKLSRARWSRLVRRLARLSYERWLTAHRLTGLFFIAAFAHAAIVDPVFRRSTLLLVVFCVVGGLGTVAYAYRELFARFVIPIHDYTVAEVRRPTDTTLTMSLEPAREPIAFAPGQFVFLMFGGERGWQRHPFSIASGPSDPRLEVAIKAVGDFTEDLRDSLKPGTPARIAGPFGGFDYRAGGDRQIWIAGGIGVTPFMSWIRGLDTGFEREVDLYYSVARESDALYHDEIAAAAAAHATLHEHLIVTDRDGRLTAERMAGGDGADGVWVYMCGPPGMTAALSKGFIRLGVPPSRIRWEEFDVR